MGVQWNPISFSYRREQSSVSYDTVYQYRIVLDSVVAQDTTVYFDRRDSSVQQISSIGLYALRETQGEVQYLTLPVYLTWRRYWGRWSLHAGLGFQLSRRLASRGTLREQTNSLAPTQVDLPPERFRRWVPGFNARLGVGYVLSPHWEVGVAPTFSYSLQPGYGDPNNQLRFHSLSGQLWVRFRW